MALTIKQQDKQAASGEGIDVVVAEAQRRHNYCLQWYGDAYNKFSEDYKFAHGDSDNNYQWPGDIYQGRQGAPNGESGHPCLTINKVRQHNLLIVNDAKRNKPGIKYSPIGNQATADSADVMNCLARHVEQQSNATAHYDKATAYMVEGGFGWWRVVTDYRDTDTFNQEIYIRPIQNPRNVWIDPNTVQPDNIDAKYGFVVEDIAREFFEAKYPKFKDLATQDQLSGGDVKWYGEKTIRVAEYYRIVGVPDTLWAYIPSGADQPVFVRESMLTDPELKAKVSGDPRSKSRPIMVEKLEWYLIVGNKIADKRLVMPGKYVPLVRITGEETVIDGQYDCKSHTRALKDSQRMYNYWASSAVEYGALQTKTPWVASKEAIEGNVNDWNSANVNNKSVLLYNEIADDGQTKLSPPQRIMPPVSAPVALDGMKIADEQMMSVSGQYHAMLGAPSNERSGKAIQERQRQGDTATYHYIDAVALGIRKTGKILLDLYPNIYDAPQVIQALGEDGKTVQIQIDPSLQKAYELKQIGDQQAVLRVLNPKIGQYDVVSDVGPSFGTKREEAFNAFMALLGQAPQLVPVLGDVLLSQADFPMSEIAAERLRRMVPPHILGEGPSMKEQELMGMVTKMREMIGTLMTENSTTKMKLKGKDQQRTVDVYKAITARMKVELDAAADAGQLDRETVMRLLEMTAQNAAETEESADMVDDASAPNLELLAQAGQLLSGNVPGAPGENEPPFPGAKMGADGQWYGRDLSNSKQYRPV